MVTPKEQKPQSNEKVAGENLRYATFSRGLKRYLEMVENFFPYAAAQISIAQQIQNARDTDKYFPEEIEMERDELRDHLSGILPRAIRGSALVVLYSAFESTVIDFSNDLASDLQKDRFDPFDGRGSFPKKANKHFADIFNVQLFSDKFEKTSVYILLELRNSFVHHQSTFSRLPPNIQESITGSRNRLMKCHVHKDTWVPSIECITAHGELIQHWARLLGNRVMDLGGVDDYL